MPKKIDMSKAPTVAGTLYPPPYDIPCLKRHRTKIGDAAGLTQFGVNICRLPPGAWSAQRHWHHHEDELIYVLEGEVVLVTDSGEEIMRPGDSAGFKAGDPDAHCFQNRSKADAVILEIGTRWPEGESVDYPDIDLRIRPSSKGYEHRDGTPYPIRPRQS
jgi:uncharacterized cupin superfamily protein